MLDFNLHDMDGLLSAEAARRHAATPLNCLSAVRHSGLNIDAGDSRWPTPHVNLQAACVIQKLALDMQQEFLGMTAQALKLLTDAENLFVPTSVAKPRILISAELNQRHTLEITWEPAVYKPRDAQAHWLLSTDFKQTPSLKRQHLVNPRAVVRFLAKEWLTPEFNFFVEPELRDECQMHLRAVLADCLDAFLVSLSCVADVTVLDWIQVSGVSQKIQRTDVRSRAVQRLTRIKRSLEPKFSTESNKLNNLVSKAGFESINHWAAEVRAHEQSAEPIAFSRYLFEKRGTRISSLQLDKLQREVAQFLPLQKCWGHCTATLDQLMARTGATC